MEAPPIYTPPPAAPPPRQSRAGMWIAIAIGGMCLCTVPIFAAILFPVFQSAKVAATKTQCLTNVKQLALAQVIYASEWDDRFPPAERWMDGVKAFNVVGLSDADAAAYRCPLVTDGHGYAMSNAMSTKRTSELESPRTTILLFETSDLAYNAHGDPKKVVKIPRHTSQSVALADGSARHLGTPTGKTTFAP